MPIYKTSFNWIFYALPIILIEPFLNEFTRKYDDIPKVNIFGFQLNRIEINQFVSIFLVMHIINKIYLLRLDIFNFLLNGILIGVFPLLTILSCAVL